MPSNKYHTARRKDTSGGDNDIAGIVLIVVSAFILLCICIPPILGPFSQKVIYPIVTGVLGLFAYPLFLCTLLLGIALLQGRSADLSARYKWGIFCSVLFLMLILQAATTHGLLGKSFSSYMSGTYHSRVPSAGGVLFGIVAYGIARAVTPVVAYMLYVLALLVSVSICFLLPMYRRRRAAAPERQEKMPLTPFVKGSATPQATQPLGDRSLYVDTIRPNVPTAPVPDDLGAPAPTQMPPTGGYVRPAAQAPADTVFEPYHKVNGGATTDKREHAKSVLFGTSPYGQSEGTYGASYGAGEVSRSQGISYTPSAVSSGSSASSSSLDYYQAQQEYRERLVREQRDKAVLPPVTAAPTVRDTSVRPPVPEPPPARPEKRFHGDSAFSPLHVAEIPEKDFSAAIVDGEIINGDTRSEELEAQREKDAPTSSTPKAKEYEAAPKVDMASVRPREPVAATPPPIVNGDYFGNPERKRAEAPKPAPVEKPAEPPAPTIPPIVKGSTYETQSTEERFRALLREDRAHREEPRIEFSSPTPKPTFAQENGDMRDEDMRDDETAPEEEFDTPVSEDDTPYEEPPVPLSVDFGDFMQEDDSLIAAVLPEQSRTSSLTVEEEPIDLSEKSHFEGEDATGYYESVALPGSKSTQKPTEQTTVPPVSSPTQLKIDDCMPTVVPPPKPKKKKHTKYNPPRIDMLTPADERAPGAGDEECEEKARMLEETLQGLKLPAKVTGVTHGPTVTRYELDMPPGIPIKRIEQFSTDIEYYLASNGKIRIETPIPGKKAVGIEVPNQVVDIVRLREIIESKEFQNASSPLTLALGKDIGGTNILCNLEKMPHLLIAGATGSGKSACLNSIIISILYKASPEDVRLILIDPKRVEFNLYQGIPHLMGPEIINDAQQAINALTWAKDEMDRRYILFGSHKVRALADYNKCEAVRSGEEEKLPYIVLIVDELAELMLDNNKKVLENKIMSMAQKARAAGIHLILATQRPSVDVITGTIKANFPSRIAFSVKSIVDSRTILDVSGAETLLGRGDMLYSPVGVEDAKRVQGAFVTDPEVGAITEYVRENNVAEYDEDFGLTLVKHEETTEESDADDDKEYDSLMPEVLKCVIESGGASTSMIQRRFSVGYARASRIIDQMEAHKFIGPLEGSKPRAVYISREEYKAIFGIEI